MTTASRHHGSILWAWGVHGVLLLVCGLTGFFTAVVDEALIREAYGESWLAELCLTTIRITAQTAWPLTISALITLAVTLAYLRPSAAGKLLFSVMVVAQAILVGPACWWLYHAIEVGGIGKLISALSEIGTALMLIAGAALTLWALWRPAEQATEGATEGS